MNELRNGHGIINISDCGLSLCWGERVPGGHSLDDIGTGVNYIAIAKMELGFGHTKWPSEVASLDCLPYS